MDLTGLIFVGLVIAWAVYLVPKVLQHHDEVSRSHSVDRFSSTMRVLARRDSTVTATQAAPVTGRRPSAAQVRARREAARVAARRRRRVLGTVLVLNLLVAGLAGFGVIGWAWQVAPAALLVAWLVACRLMVKGERAVAATWSPVGRPVGRAAEPAEGAELPAAIETEVNEQGFEEISSVAETTTIPAIKESLWDPVPTTLPTYVSKPAAARRTVRTIDLGAPGAWTSGRTDEDSAIAREADHAEREAKTRSRLGIRKTGS